MFLFALLTLLAACLWLWPFTRRVLRSSPYFEPLAFFTGVGLSLGILSLLMLWLGLLPGAWLRAEIVLPIPWIGLSVSVWLARKQIAAWRPAWPARREFNLRWWLSVDAVPLWLGLICIGALAIITLNLVSYPFYRDDVLSRYAPNARTLFTQAHIPDSLTGYPLGVQLLYTFGFMAAGAVNDHLAGLLSAALVAGMVGSVWVVARLLFSNRAAWAATVLTVSSPVFVNWSTSGYLDIPEGFFHGLTFALVYLWLKKGELRYAVLAGVLGGLSMWIKHSSIVLIPALAVVPILRLWPLSWSRTGREIGLGAAALGLVAIIAGPWFLRSYLLAGSGGVFPAPSTYDALFVDHSLDALIAFWQRREEWGLPLAIAALAGITLWMAVLVWPRLSGLPEPDGEIRRIVLLWIAFVVPYHFIWWWGFTYQARYLFPSLPMYAAVAGLAIDRFLFLIPLVKRLLIARYPAAADFVTDRFSFIIHRSSFIVGYTAVALAAVLVGYGIYPRLGAAYHLVTDPLQSDDVKLTRLAGDRWLTAKYVRENVALGVRLFVMDGALAYWLHDYELQVGYPTRLDDLQGYDYYVTAPWGDKVLSALGNSAEALNRSLNDPGLFTKLYAADEEGQIIYAVNFK